MTTATVGAAATTYSATGLSAGATYYYRVRATNAVGDSANTSMASTTTGILGVPVAVPVPDGDFSLDAAANCINSDSGGGQTFTSPMTATLSGWNVSATPSTANGGFYSAWEPYGVLDTVASGGSASPYNSNVVWIGNQPASTYNALIYYPGELYNYGSVVGGAQPGASFTMTTTGITAAAVAGSAYIATIEYANVSWSNSAVNPSANVALNILANGVVVGTGALSGLAQNSPWTTVTASWVAQAANAGQTIQLQVVATNFLEGPGSNDQWQVPTIGFANATLTATAPPTAPSGLTATAISSSQINLSWTNNAVNQTGFKIDQATSSDFTQGLTTVTVGAATTTYSATGLSPNTTYYYRVRSTTAVGDSANTPTASATTGFLGAPVAVPVPDGDFSADAAANYMNSNTGGGLTFTAPLTATLSGWNVSATPSTANGGFYSAWEPYGVLDTVTSGGSAAPYNSNVVWIGNQPASTYNALIYYPGELYNYGNVVGGAQPGASFAMTTTGITAAAVAGSTYTATIEYANVSWGSSAVNPSANVCSQHPRQWRRRRHGRPFGTGAEFALDHCDGELGGPGG